MSATDTPAVVPPHEIERQAAEFRQVLGLPPDLELGPAPPDDGEGNGGGGDRDLTLLVYLDIRKRSVMVFPRCEDWQWDCGCEAESGSHQPPVLRIHHKNDAGEETISRIVAARVVAVSEVWS